MFENIINEDVLMSLSHDELMRLDEILKDIPPYDSIEEAEKKAQKMYKTYAKSYTPYVKAIEGDEKKRYILSN